MSTDPKRPTPVTSERRIRELAAELAPVRPLPRLRSLAAVAAGAWALAVAVEWVLGGPQPLSERSGSPVFLGVLLGVAGLAVGGLVSALATAVPGRDASARVGLLVAGASGALLLAVGLLALAGAPAGRAGVAVPWYCIGRAAWLGALPAAALLAFGRRAFALRPLWTAAAAGLGALGLGAVAVQLSCADDGALHVLLGHAGGPVLLAAALSPPAGLWLRRRATAG